ncbi:DNA recombination protein RmuC [Calditerrivibrio sp.]|jgi:DNA recombination protein RmuC|uniref:DNA recombination protein RmuC n=1 Tax=Calditerrivibrio sp. TaxID=2792612 RepID=UPI003D0E5AB5
MDYVVIGLIVLNLLLLVFLFKKVQFIDLSVIGQKIDMLERNNSFINNIVKDELTQSRGELREMMQEQRRELFYNFQQFTEASAQKIADLSIVQKEQLENFDKTLTSFLSNINENLDATKLMLDNNLKQLREEISVSLKGIIDTNAKIIGELGQTQKQQLEQLSYNILQLTENLNDRFDRLKLSVDDRLEKIREDNTKQLEQMRQTVDEKLQGTLEKRLGESFRLVSERLEQVYKGLGEMQTLASGVGDLKKVLSNVKSRGILGEIQLEQMLEQVLTPDQYLKNVSPKGNNENVEFAIKLPSKSDKDDIVLLPIDAKFPMEDYNRLIDAFDAGNLSDIESASKLLEQRIKGAAKDICEKYINPPVTTDFAVMYLPVEGLFAEVVRKPGLIDTIQKNYKVVIAGPTTLWAVLNSLQMGFRTLAIEKRSSEVWNLLAAVKTEWSRYGDVLDQVKKKLEQATDTIDKVRTRSNVVGRKLKSIEQLPDEEAKKILEMDDIIDE